MNSRNRSHYLLLLSLVVSTACSVTERRDETITRQWPAAQVKAIDLDEVDGSVTVEAAATDSISLVAHVRAGAEIKEKPAEENKGYFQTVLAGGTLSVSRRGGRRTHWSFFGFSDGKKLKIDYKLRVPPSVTLELKTVNGRISTRGMDAASRLVTVNGTIETESTGNSELVARTVNGSVRARFLDNFQGANVKTVNGAVEATLPQNASFSVDLSQVNGDFEASFPLSIHSNPGSRRVSGEVNGGHHELTIVTVNGDIELDTAAGKPRLMQPESPVMPGLPAVPQPGSTPVVPPAPPAPLPSAPTT